MNFLAVVILIILILIDILINGFFIGCAVMNFKNKNYFHAGVDVVLAVTSLAMLIKAVVS